MNEVAVLEIGREAMIVILKTAGPLMAAALLIGLAIALLQALTTIQEMTLTFVPKIVVMFLTAIVLLPFMINTLIDFTHSLFDRIVAGG